MKKCKWRTCSWIVELVKLVRQQEEEEFWLAVLALNLSLTMWFGNGLSCIGLLSEWKVNFMSSVSSFGFGSRVSMTTFVHWGVNWLECSWMTSRKESFLHHLLTKSLFEVTPSDTAKIIWVDLETWLVFNLGWNHLWTQCSMCMHFSFCPKDHEDNLKCFDSNGYIWLALPTQPIWIIHISEAIYIWKCQDVGLSGSQYP